MAGAGIGVTLDSEYDNIIAALHRASMPALQAIARSGGLALQKVSKEAFAKEANPATGEKWAPRKDTSIKRPLLEQRGILKKSISFHAFPDGSVIIGSNLVYARIHQEGGKTSPHVIKARNMKALSFLGICRKLVHHPGSDIPSRPYLGVPEDFEREFFDDPAIKDALGMAAE